MTESRLRVRSHLTPGTLYDELEDKPRTRRMGKRNIKAQVNKKVLVSKNQAKISTILYIVLGISALCFLKKNYHIIETLY